MVQTQAVSPISNKAADVSISPGHQFSIVSIFLNTSLLSDVLVLLDQLKQTKTMGIDSPSCKGTRSDFTRTLTPCPPTDVTRLTFSPVIASPQLLFCC